MNLAQLHHHSVAAVGHVDVREDKLQEEGDRPEEDKRSWYGLEKLDMNLSYCFVWRPEKVVLEVTDKNQLQGIGFECCCQWSSAQ